MRAEEWEEHDFQMQRLLKVLRTRRKIVVVAGAGISVSAGSKFTTPHGDFEDTSLTYLQFQTFVRPPDCLTVSKHNIISRPLDSSYSTLLCTEMTTQQHRFTIWFARCLI
jgi:hypothetical protein